MSKKVATFLYFANCVAAFSSVSVPSHNIPSSVQDDGNHRMKSTSPSPVSSTKTTSASWKIVLDIGREPLANGVPFDWARSGCRMPLKVPLEFNEENMLLPLSDTVSFTGPDGAVIRPVEGNNWKIRQDKDISFELFFPETLARRDVTIEAGTTIECSGAIFTKSELENLNAAFYEAREAAWEVGGQLNDMSSRQGAPKQWNEETKSWEKRSTGDSPLSWVQKRISYMSAKANQEAKNQQRPDPNLLSAPGKFPGINEPVFVAKSGVVRIPSNKNAVIGKWYAEPTIP